jgi:hypothetical protein
MNHTSEKVLLLLIVALLQIHISACATIQGVWEKIKGRQFEKQTSTREEAAKSYGYKGLTDELIVEPPRINPTVVSPGDKVKQELQFTLLSPQEERRFKVTKIIDISIGKDTIELARKKSEMTQGTHISILQFVLPKDIEPGEYKIITSISIEKRSKIVHGSFKVKR